MNSIAENLDKDYTINSIRLHLRDHPSEEDKAWVIVEGETDQKLFSKLINGRHVEVEQSFSGLNGVLKCVSELLKETKLKGTGRILGIRDADFLRLGEEEEENPAHIFLTDCHDAEMMMVSCDRAYASVEAEYLRHEKTSYPSREELFTSIAFLGGVRWLNDSEDLGLNFRGLGLGSFYSPEKPECDKGKCLDEILKRSPKKKKEISEKEVESKIQDVSDYLNLCNGHDFQKAFALCAGSVSESKKGVKDKEIGRVFRVAYRLEDFKKTDLRRQLKEFSDQNQVPLFEESLEQTGLKPAVQKG
ncbi:conserved hypothetical protein [Candidatus Desulfarcum epimagneticum]|uniref:Uncharacterized protein n=1 Tax=uncultured Desulfobacteraceae bacterium TaxID=218296 RepID=A0A484HIG4_9BACT|nr:conserved hypothetical protein [uncultured Desulfobacteraceae bacterium]